VSFVHIARLKTKIRHETHIRTTKDENTKKGNIYIIVILQHLSQMLKNTGDNTGEGTAVPVHAMMAHGGWNV